MDDNVLPFKGLTKLNDDWRTKEVWSCSSCEEYEFFVLTTDGMIYCSNCDGNTYINHDYLANEIDE